MAGRKYLSPSVQFSHSVMSNSLRPHGLQHARPPCPSPTPGVHPNSSPLSQWCHPTISSSVIPFSSCLQSFPASGSFQMRQLFASGGQSMGVSASVSVLPRNIQGHFPLGLLGWSPCSRLRDSQDSSPASQFESISSLALCLLYGPALTSIHDYWEDHNLDCTNLCWRGLLGLCLLFYALSRSITAFLPRCKCLLILWLQSPSAVILEPQKRKSVPVSIVSPSICHEVMGLDAMICFLSVEF